MKNKNFKGILNHYSKKDVKFTLFDSMLDAFYINSSSNLRKIQYSKKIL